MSESDTPRTHEFEKEKLRGEEAWLKMMPPDRTPYRNGLNAGCEFARTLERELNEAKAEIGLLKEALDCGPTMDTVEALMKERDEARVALSDMLSQTVRIVGDVWELPSCSTDEVKRWRKSAGLEQLCT